MGKAIPASTPASLCDADLNNDCIVNVIDLGLFRLGFGGTDLGRFRLGFLSTPGPSGVTDNCGAAL